MVQFTSDKPASEIMAHLQKLLSDLDCELKVNEKAYTIDASHARGKDDEGYVVGMITMHAQVFVLAERLHLIEIRRGRGDIIEYKALLDKVNAGLTPMRIAAS